MFFRYLLYFFLLYLLIRLVFNFIIPVFKTTRQVKKEFRNMHNNMQDYMNQEQGTKEQVSTPDKNPPEKAAGDYIDFEEVK